MALPAPDLDRLPLESGDRLSREEFHHRYEQWPEIKKAELIDGTVYVASPARLQHSTPHGAIASWLGVYASTRDNVAMHVEQTCTIASDAEVQPDAALRYVEGGTALATPDGYLQGPPEFVVEVAASSASNDLHQKRALYERSSVQEYVVWQVYDRVIRWFRLHDGRYVEIDPGESTTVESAVFPGLRLDCEAMLAGDLATVLAAVQSASNQ